MNNNFPGGVWPVMLTPFTKNQEIDYRALEALIEWYIDHGVHGLFAVCQSSEMFFLSKEESIQVARFIKEKAGDRVPVIASGNTSSNLEETTDLVKEMASVGVDAVILITNQFAKEEESDDVFLKNVHALLDRVPDTIPLGFYECPYPYKRLITPHVLKEIAETGRFYFLKDTSCDTEQIKEKLTASQGTNLKIYNANTATLLETLQAGIAGYSGVMANFQPELYVWLTAHFSEQPEKASRLHNFLSISALIERQNYPKNAKYNLQEEGLPWTSVSRTQPDQPLTATEKLEVHQLRALNVEYQKQYIPDIRHT